jgi:hypothetical protein
MADWFKFFENGLDEPRLQYAIGQLPEVTPVWVGILSECCRTKSGVITWDDDEAYLMGFSRRLNVSVPKVNEAVNLLKRIRYNEIASGLLTVLKWSTLQSEYMRKKERVKQPVSGQSPDKVGFCPPRGEERRGEEKRVDKTQSGAKAPVSKWEKPGVEQVRLEGLRIGLPETECDKFRNYYESNGWRVGRNPMKSWPHALINWKNTYQTRTYESNQRNGQNRAPNRNAGTFNENRDPHEFDHIGRVEP